MTNKIPDIKIINKRKEEVLSNKKIEEYFEKKKVRGADLLPMLKDDKKK